MLLSPLPLFGHGSGVLFAKLSFLPSSQVSLEFTAEYGLDAMLNDQDEARQVLLNTLRVASENSLERGSDLKSFGEPKFTAPLKLDPTAPGAYADVRADDGHSLLCGSWTWAQSGETMTISVAKNTPYDVVLWTIPPDGKMESSKQYYLISGDKTQPIALPKAAQIGTASVVSAEASANVGKGAANPAQASTNSGRVGIGLLWIGGVMALLVGFILLQPKRREE
jgi:hypothetical protein